MIISYSKNFAFIHLQKTGGTAVEEALTPYLDYNDIVLGGTTFGQDLMNIYTKQYGEEYLGEKGFWKHPTAAQMKKIVGEDLWNKMYKFTTVRNPEKIMISWYYYIQQYIVKSIKELELKSFDDIVYKPLSVKEDYYDYKIENNKLYVTSVHYLRYCQSFVDNTFIDGFIQKSLLSDEEKFAPQIEKIDSSVEMFDIRQIKENWGTILNKIGIDEYFELPLINVSKKPKVIPRLKDETIDLIREYYKKDYEIIPGIINVDWK